MVKAGDVISYLDLCKEEGVNLQRGMNFHLHNKLSVILMSLRTGSPYMDKIEENGKVLIYEGHDIPAHQGGRNPKIVDQPMTNPSGSLSQNGLFFSAATNYKLKNIGPELVKVYEKIRPGVWVYNGIFRLVGAKQEISEGRKVFKFRLELTDENPSTELISIDHNRIIPSHIKIEVWKRDKGHCVICGSSDNLHFDHIIPYSKGGSSLVSENIQLLCARHNIAKRDKIE
jgi:hypothetical protein